MALDSPQPLSVTRSQVEGVTVFRLSGELDLASSPALRQELFDLIDGGEQPSVQVDLADMTFIDTTGLNVLVTAMRRLAAMGGNLIVANPRPSTLRLFQIAGLTTVLDIRTGRDSEKPTTGAF